MALRCRQQPDVIASDVIAIALVPNIHVSLRSDLQGYIVRPIHNEHTSHDKYIVSFGESTLKTLLPIYILLSYISELMKIQHGISVSWSSFGRYVVPESRRLSFASKNRLCVKEAVV